MNETNIPRLHAIVEGHVHGVGFRAFVIRRASSLGVTGWVRNRWDGTVEVVAEGERPDLESAGFRAAARPSLLQGDESTNRLERSQRGIYPFLGESDRLKPKPTLFEGDIPPPSDHQMV